MNRTTHLQSTGKDFNVSAGPVKLKQHEPSEPGLCQEAAPNHCVLSLILAASRKRLEYMASSWPAATPQQDEAMSGKLDRGGGLEDEGQPGPGGHPRLSLQ
jgi:hypothetical protein